MSKYYRYNSIPRSKTWDGSSTLERVLAIVWFITTLLCFAGLGVLAALGF